MNRLDLIKKDVTGIDEGWDNAILLMDDVRALITVVEAAKEYDLKRRTHVMKADIAWRALLAALAELYNE